jgi:ketosteroid isomerase-like protein
METVTAGMRDANDPKEGFQMAGNTDVLREGYAAYGRGDIDAAMENWSDDIEWENPNAQQIPNPGVYKGKDEVRRVLTEIPQLWDDFRLSPDEFYEQGDTVVVLGHIEARAKETGRDVKLPFVHIWRMSDGTATRFQNLFDTALAAEALGRL